jgi:hypothetical protein
MPPKRSPTRRTPRREQTNEEEMSRSDEEATGVGEIAPLHPELRDSAIGWTTEQKSEFMGRYGHVGQRCPH